MPFQQLMKRPRKMKGLETRESRADGADVAFNAWNIGDHLFGVLPGVAIGCGLYQDDLPRDDLNGKCLRGKEHDWLQQRAEDRG